MRPSPERPPHAAISALRAQQAADRPAREAAWLRHRQAAEYQQLRDEAEASRRAADTAHSQLRQARALLPAWQAEDQARGAEGS
jgi:hypothetical protein